MKPAWIFAKEIAPPLAIVRELRGVVPPIAAVAWILLGPALKTKSWPPSMVFEIKISPVPSLSIRAAASSVIGRVNVISALFV